MNFLTALKLSGINITTKKWRILLTAFSSSIAIIGIALILSLSNGFDKQIDIFELDTLSGFPIMISRKAAEVDINAMMEQSIEMRKEIMGEETDDINNDYYKKVGNYFILASNPNNMSELYNNERAVSLKISGILRMKKDVTIPLLREGLAYSDKLSQYFINDAKDSEVEKTQREADYNIFTDEIFKTESNMPEATNENTKENILIYNDMASTFLMFIKWNNGCNNYGFSSFCSYIFSSFINYGWNNNLYIST